MREKTTKTLFSLFPLIFLSFLLLFQNQPPKPATLTSAIAGNSATTGAISAGVAEATRPLTKNKDKSTQQIASTVIGAVTGGLSGANTALEAENFNRQLHQKEIAWIEKNAKSFANKNNLSPNDAKILLTLAALGMVDANSNAQIQELIHKGVINQEDILKAQEYIKSNVVKENATFEDEHRHYGDELVPKESKTQLMFTVSKEQYFDSNYNPNVDLGGLQDNTLDVIPLTKGFGLAAKEGGSLVKAGVEKIDDALSKSVDDALDISLKRPTINDNIFDSKPISREEAIKLLEERYIKQGNPPEKAKSWAETTVDSFEGQITTRMVLDGDTFILNHNPKIDKYPPTGTYVIKKENANKTPYELQKELALPKKNHANAQVEVTVTKPHQVLEGEVKGQEKENWAWDHAIGGGQQTVVDPKSTNRDEIFKDK